MRLIKLGKVQRGTDRGTPERSQRHLGAVPAGPETPRGRVGLDVPIETKLHAPNPRPEWMERPELTGYLARTSVKLVLVDAPAGFGKTTVVAQWRSSALESRPFAWVSLCLLYTSPSPRDPKTSRMPSSA